MARTKVPIVPCVRMTATFPYQSTQKNELSKGCEYLQSSQWIIELHSMPPPQPSFFHYLPSVSTIERV